MTVKFFCILKKLKSCNYKERLNIPKENLVKQIAANINSQEQMQPSQIIGRGQGRGGSDIFQLHFKKSKQPNANGLYEVTCNYCQKIYAFRIGGGYGTFRRHLTTKHPNQLGVEK